MFDGIIVNVFPELELEGVADIWTQLLKLLDDNCKEPEHVVFEVLVVMVVGAIVLVVVEVVIVGVVVAVVVVVFEVIVVVVLVIV